VNAENCSMRAHEAQGNKQHAFRLICSLNRYFKKEQSTYTLAHTRTHIRTYD